MSEPRLFDPARTTLAKCETCGAIREPGEPRAERCEYDLDPGDVRRRPAGCLNAIDPATSPFPEGF